MYLRAWAEDCINILAPCAWFLQRFRIDCFINCYHFYYCSWWNNCLYTYIFFWTFDYSDNIRLLQGSFWTKNPDFFPRVVFSWSFAFLFATCPVCTVCHWKTQSWLRPTLPLFFLLYFLQYCAIGLPYIKYISYCKINVVLYFKFIQQAVIKFMQIRYLTAYDAALRW